MTDAALSIEHVTFSFGKTVAVTDFSLEVPRGSFTTLLGPSGCGKTTLLRLISGFLEPQSGCIKIDGNDQRGIAPNLRRVGMVFQDYALFPHLTVEQNLLYGLKLKKDVATTERNGLIQQTARVLGLSALLERYPHELSGGQQQRVALGRVLVLKPSILLMDEPLSSLDAKLRTQVREELQDVQRALGITTIYVTHDQEEALSLSDRIAVLHRGQLQQTGSAQDVYFRPANRFVADFVGVANFLEDKTAGRRLMRMVRPEWLNIATLRDGAEHKNVASSATDDVYTALTGTVVSASFLGAVVRYRVRCAAFMGGSAIVDAATTDGAALTAGTQVALTVHKDYVLS